MTSPLTRTKADAAALALSVDKALAEPLHGQLGGQLRRMILAGRIAPGSRLPSSRALADDLGVSRATVVLAYEQLESEGYLDGRPGAGMYVAPSLPEHVLQVAAAPAPEAKSEPVRPSKLPRTEPFKPFQLGAADPSLFPFEDWARLLHKTWRKPKPELLGALPTFGLPELRLSIAQHLKEWRGITCDANQIVVTSGTVDATDLIAGVAFGRGTAVYVEDPGYPALRYALGSLGIATVPVPVDGDGFNLDRAPGGHAPNLRGAVVTPSRQFPLGVTLPLGRRLALLEWAASIGGYIVEDDFDSEYRYHGTPLPALMSLDGNGRSIYMGSFSKVLSPALRLGFVVLPERLVAAAQQHLRRRGVMASLVAQPVLAELMASGDYATHIRRTRRVYAKRLQALVAELAHLSDLLTVTPATAGMHVVADLASGLAVRMSEREAASAAASAGVLVAPLADFYAGTPRREALLLGFAGFAEPHLKRAVRRLAVALS